MDDIRGIADISGFSDKDMKGGSAYEAHCQKMLQAGYEWLEKNKAKRGKLKGHSYSNIFGMFEPDSKAAKEMSEAVCKAAPDCSSAQHHAVMRHLFYIAGNGIEKWKAEIKKSEKKSEAKKR